MIQIQTVALWSGLLIDINIGVCSKGVVSCIFVQLHSTTSLLLLPFTANQTLLQLHGYFLGFYLILLFICSCPREVVLGQAQSCLQSDDQWKEGGCQSGRFGVYLCVYTIMLLCFTSQIKCQQKQVLKFEVAKLQPFSEPDVCIGIQCCISFMCGELNSPLAPGVWQQGAVQLHRIMYKKELHFNTVDIL